MSVSAEGNKAPLDIFLAAPSQSYQLRVNNVTFSVLREGAQSWGPQRNPVTPSCEPIPPTLCLYACLLWACGVRRTTQRVVPRDGLVSPIFSRLVHAVPSVTSSGFYVCVRSFRTISHVFSGCPTVDTWVVCTVITPVRVFVGTFSVHLGARPGVELLGWEVALASRGTARLFFRVAAPLRISAKDRSSQFLQILPSTCVSALSPPPPDSLHPGGHGVVSCCGFHLLFPDH